MYISYTDASVRDSISYLSFTVVFEDRSEINRRIVVKETNSNVAEGLAFEELISFIDYYNFKNGIILYDSTYIRAQLKRLKNQLNKKTTIFSVYALKVLRNNNIQTQLIPRKFNYTHKICYKERYYKSTNISSVDRNTFVSIQDYPDYFLEFSVYEHHKHENIKSTITFHDFKLKLNKMLRFAKLITEDDGHKIYALNEKRIKVFQNKVVKIYEEK